MIIDDPLVQDGSVNFGKAKYQNGDITVVEKFLNVTEEWTRTSEKVKNEAVTNFKDPQLPC